MIAYMNDVNHEYWPKVGVAAMIIKDGKVLMGKRKNTHGSGDLAFPGGKMEHMESIEECVRHEVREEAGIEIKNIKFLRLLNLKGYPPKHFVDIGFVADWASGEPTVMEPEKCEGWDWYPLNAIPKERLFYRLDTFFEAYETGKNFFDE